MKCKLSMIILLLILCSGMSPICAQESMDTSGAVAVGSGGSVSYSVGQVATLALSGASGTVLQGVQQPWEVYLVTKINVWNDLSQDCSVYPNPAGDFLKLKVEGWNQEKLLYRLYDLSGKIYGSGQVMSSETTIPVSFLLSGAYLLSIARETDLQIQSFKIIKN